MPELPEVETVVRQLAAVLPGNLVTAVTVHDRKRLKLPVKAFEGRKIRSVRRAGKQIVIEFSKGTDALFMAVHLRMTGRLIWFDRASKRVVGGDGTVEFKHAQSASAQNHVRAEFRCKRGTLIFSDARRFGTLQIAREMSEFASDAIDPTHPEFSAALLGELLKHSKQPLKTWLLRQDKLVGIGNIYASEILYASRIHPLRAGCTLSEQEIKLLHRNTVRILTRAIENCGTTFSDFQDSTGETGNYQKYLAVYDRESGPCRRCKKPIIRLVQAQRSTYYCKSCQV